MPGFVVYGEKNHMEAPKTPSKRVGKSLSWPHAFSHCLNYLPYSIDNKKWLLYLDVVLALACNPML